MRLARQIPPQIYLQAHDTEGHLLDATQNEVTWCVDQINENDTVYILATLELAALLERLANDAEYISVANDPYRHMALSDAVSARARAAHIRKELGQSDKERR